MAFVFELCLCGLVECLIFPVNTKRCILDLARRFFSMIQVEVSLWGNTQIGGGGLPLFNRRSRMVTSVGMITPLSPFLQTHQCLGDPIRINTHPCHYMNRTNALQRPHLSTVPSTMTCPRQSKIFKCVEPYPVIAQRLQLHPAFPTVSPLKAPIIVEYRGSALPCQPV